MGVGCDKLIELSSSFFLDFGKYSQWTAKNLYEKLNFKFSKLKPLNLWKNFE